MHRFSAFNYRKSIDYPPVPWAIVSPWTRSYREGTVSRNAGAGTRISSRSAQCLLACILAAGILGAATPPTPAPSASPATVPANPGHVYAELDSFLQEQIDALGIPGAAVAVVRDGVRVHTAAFGRADDSGRPMTAQTPALLASTSKTLTDGRCGRRGLRPERRRHLTGRAWEPADLRTECRLLRRRRDGNRAVAAPGRNGAVQRRTTESRLLADPNNAVWVLRE